MRTPPSQGSNCSHPPENPQHSKQRVSQEIVTKLKQKKPDSVHPTRSKRKRNETKEKKEKTKEKIKRKEVEKDRLENRKGKRKGDGGEKKGGEEKRERREE